LSLADAGKFLMFNLSGAGSLLIPTNAQAAFPIGTEIRFAQMGAGQITVGSSTGTAAITVVGTNTFVSTSATYSSYDIDMPTGIQNGDGIIVHIELASLAPVFTVPTGWAVVGVAPIGPTGAGAYTFKKVNASLSDSGSTVTFAHNAAGVPAVAVVVALRGVNTADFIDGTAPAGASTTSTQTGPVLTTVAANCIELSMVGRSSGTTSTPGQTPPADITLLAQGATNLTAVNSAAAIGVALTPVAAGSSIGNSVWSGGYGSARTIAVKPAASGVVTVRSAGGAYKTAAQYADGVLTKVGTNEWLVSGYMGV